MNFVRRDGTCDKQLSQRDFGGDLNQDVDTENFLKELLPLWYVGNAALYLRQVQGALAEV